MSWLRLVFVIGLILSQFIGLACADISPKWASIIKDANKVFGFQIPVHLLRGADGTLHTVVWSRTLPSEAVYKSAYIYRPISSTGTLGAFKVVGETTEALTYLPGVLEQADGSLRIYFYSTDSDPRTIRRAVSDVTRTTWNVENIASLSPANFRTGLITSRNSTGDILHTVIAISDYTRKLVLIKPGQEPVNALSSSSAPGALWLGAFSQNGGDSNIAYFLSLDPKNNNKSSIGSMQTVPALGSVTSNLQGKSSLGKGFEDTVTTFGTLMSAAQRIGVPGELIVYAVATKGKTSYTNLNLWSSDTATSILAGAAKEAIRGVALAPTPGGGAFIGYYTASSIYVRQINSDLSRLGRITKVTGPKLGKKTGTGYLTQLQMNGATGALDIFSSITNLSTIEYGYSRLLPIIEFAVTPKTVKKKGATSLTFTLTSIEGAPLAGAEVSLIGTKTKVLTDSTGVAVISTDGLKKKSSKVQFKISATGFQTETISLDVKP